VFPLPLDTFEIFADQDFLRAQFLDQFIEMFFFTGFKPDESVGNILLICKKIVFTFYAYAGLRFHIVIIR
jgi:hypothetical protein